jgi:putative transposase
MTIGDQDGEPLHTAADRICTSAGSFGVPIAEITRKMGISDVTFYRWKKQYSGLEGSEIHRLKELEDENRRLKQLVANLTLDKQMLQDVLSKKL